MAGVQLTGGGVAVVAGLAVGGLALWVMSRKAGAVADTVGEAISDTVDALTPWNRENVAYRGVNALGSAASGDENWTLGGWLYDAINGSPEEQGAEAAEAARRAKLEKTIAEQPASWGSEGRRGSAPYSDGNPLENPGGYNFIYF